MASSWTDGASAKQAFLNDGYYQDDAQRQAAMKYTYDQLQGGNVNADPWALTSATYATENPNDPGVVAQQQKAQQSLQDWMTRGGGMAGMGGSAQPLNRAAWQQQMAQLRGPQMSMAQAQQERIRRMMQYRQMMQQAYQNYLQRRHSGGFGMPANNQVQGMTSPQPMPNYGLGQVVAGPSSVQYGNNTQNQGQTPNLMSIYGNS